MTVRLEHLFLVFAIFVLFVCNPASGAEGSSKRGVKPVVLVIRIGNTSFEEEIETRFVTDLGLYIEDFDIEEEPAPSGVFINRPLNQQIQLIKPIMKRRHAVAAMWLDVVSQDVLLLQVMVLDTDRALVRLFEHSLSQEGSPKALALSASELLGTAYLLDTKEKTHSVPIEKFIDKSKKKALDTNKKWGYTFDSITSNDIISTLGPTIRTGGALGVERNLLPYLALAPSLGGRTGPLGLDRGDVVSGYELFVALRLFVGPHLGRVRLGPSLSIQTGIGNTRIKKPHYFKTDYAHWHLSGELAGELRIKLSTRITLRLAGGASINAHRLEIKQASTDEMLQKSGLLTFSGTIGLIVF